jgi:hypothetical protein
LFGRDELPLIRRGSTNPRLQARICFLPDSSDEQELIPTVGRRFAPNSFETDSASRMIPLA